MLSRKNMLEAMMRAKRFYSQSCAVQERLPALTKIIEISGPDSTKFLQGLCTNQVNQLKSHGDCVPAAFLTPKGRIFVDTLLYLQTSQTDGVSTENILIEVDEAYLSEFKRYLMMYKLKSKVSIKTPNYSVTLETEPETIANQSSDNAVVLQTTDPRHPSLGTRIIAQRSNDPIQDQRQEKQKLLVHNLLYGVAEGKPLQNRIPLECNLDLLNYISFNKGCYIGQELTARTKFKGLVRKRLVPFLASQRGDTPTTGTSQAFEPLSPIVRDNAFSQLINHTEFDSGVEVGMKLFKRIVGDVTAQHYLDNEQAVGEIVATELTGRLGVAMINLESLFSYDKGNFAVISVPKATEGGEATESESKPRVLSEKVSFVSTFKPSWFQGLDEKTNLPVDA